MKAYKLVKHENGVLQSLYSYAPTYYEVGAKTNRREWCGALCCFDSVENAERFLKGSLLHITHTIKLFEVEYEPYMGESMRGWDRKNYQVYNKSTNAVLDWIIPQGTVLAESVTLLKELYVIA